jgi:hypothetical protein
MGGAKTKQTETSLVNWATISTQGKLKRPPKRLNVATNNGQTKYTM